MLYKYSLLSFYYFMESILELLNLFVITAILVFWLIASVYLFRKAKFAGWKAIVPIYNVVCYVKIAKLSGWFAVLFFIPVINLFAYPYTQLRIARQFNLGNFGLFCLCFFPTTMLCTIYLGFSSKKYEPDNVDSTKTQVVIATLAVLLFIFISAALDFTEKTL